MGHRDAETSRTRVEDAADEMVSSVVGEQLAFFKKEHSTPVRAYAALMGDTFSRVTITWAVVEQVIEDQYRELNGLKSRREPKS